MPEDVEFFDLAYSRFSEDVLADVRRETFGHDIGQNSWTLRSEYEAFITALGLTARQRLLDVSCGAGGPALFCARASGCEVVGVDINANAVQTASDLALERTLSGRVRFQVADASAALPFEDESFESILCIDSIIHFPKRLQVLRDWHRLLRVGGKVLYTDPVVITGLVTDEELATRSSIGKFVFSPPEEDARLIGESGLHLVRCEDSTPALAQVARAWHDSRARHQARLLGLEGQERFDGLQRFFDCVSRLAQEGRLSRFIFLAVKR